MLLSSEMAVWHPPWRQRRGLRLKKLPGGRLRFRSAFSLRFSPRLPSYKLKSAATELFCSGGPARARPACPGGPPAPPPAPECLWAKRFRRPGRKVPRTRARDTFGPPGGVRFRPGGRPPGGRKRGIPSQKCAFPCRGRPTPGGPSAPRGGRNFENSRAKIAFRMPRGPPLGARNASPAVIWAPPICRKMRNTLAVSQKGPACTLAAAKRPPRKCFRPSVALTVCCLCVKS